MNAADLPAAVRAEIRCIATDCGHPSFSVMPMTDGDELTLYITAANLGDPAHVSTYLGQLASILAVTLQSNNAEVVNVDLSDDALARLTNPEGDPR